MAAWPSPLKASRRTAKNMRMVGSPVETCRNIRERAVQPRFRVRSGGVQGVVRNLAPYPKIKQRIRKLPNDWIQKTATGVRRSGREHRSLRVQRQLRQPYSWTDQRQSQKVRRPERQPQSPE